MGTSTKVTPSRCQIFPESGPLVSNLNLDRGDLIQHIGGMEGTVYCYIVKTVESVGGRFVQRGSAPNVQGGLITLCTCKRQMRAGRDVNAWRDVWIAGITGAETGHHGRDHLFYLMRVERAFASHRDLWTWLSEHAPEAAEAKAADQHRLGDVFRPQDPRGNPYDPRAYVSPCRAHVHSNGDAWHKDIDYRAFGRRPALLVGDPKDSFLWSEPLVSVPFRMGIGAKKADLDLLLGGFRGTSSL